MLKDLPVTYNDYKDWDWSDYQGHFQTLMDAPLSQDNAHDWLAQASALLIRFDEQYTRIVVANTQDTTDEAVEKRYLDFAEHVLPEAQKAMNALNEKMVRAEIEVENFDVPMRDIIADIELFREENLPLFVQESKLTTQYNKIMGTQTVEWEGKETPVKQLEPLLQDPDRAKREHIWRLIAERKLQDREQLNELWKKLVPLRHQIAVNAGFDNYRDYMWKAKKRFDYSIADAEGFHAAIEQVIVPAAQRLYERRRQQMGLDHLRPWDLAIDPLGRDPLRPYQSIDEMNQKLATVFGKVHPDFGGYYQTMIDEGLLDLDNRKGKAPGGYCTSLDLAEQSFIFMNAVGLHDDVQTLLHEGGHAFHNYEYFHQPFYQQKDTPLEFAEVASMSMELLGAPYMVEAGLYSEAEAARARIEHLEDIIRFWPYMAVVSAFQHWVYTHPEAGADPAQCDEKWGELWLRFMKGVDDTGLEDNRVTGWHRKLHIFDGPFYYIEYGIAQLGAVQVYANALKDFDKAVADYKHALSLGMTKSLPELFAAAGAKFALTADILQLAVDIIEAEIAELEKVQS